VHALYGWGQLHLSFWHEPQEVVIVSWQPPRKSELDKPRDDIWKEVEEEDSAVDDMDSAWNVPSELWNEALENEQSHTDMIVSVDEQVPTSPSLPIIKVKYFDGKAHHWYSGFILNNFDTHFDVQFIDGERRNVFKDVDTYKLDYLHK